MCIYIYTHTHTHVADMCRSSAHQRIGSDEDDESASPDGDGQDRQESSRAKDAKKKHSVDDKSR